MIKVFISHSKRDRMLIETISSALRNVDIIPVIEEFVPEQEKIPIPFAQIRRDIESSNAVFLFLTDKVMMTEYTKNWIIFEDGLAAGTDKQVFLFERKGILLEYPIPYLTDYMIFEKQSVSDLLRIQEISKQLKNYFSIEEKRQVPPEFNEGMGSIFWILYAIFKTRKKEKLLKRLNVPRLKCPRCGISFYYHSCKHKRFPCPACRGAIIHISNNTV